ncbi:MAG: hypothetical protein N2316_10380 [Spirochaetes bacterium]|nr:hypothetical protein [Spirochaetota bacterium]
MSYRFSLYCIFFLLAVLLSTPAHGIHRDIVILKLCENTISISHNGGKTFELFSQGLPQEFLPVRITMDAQGSLYLSTYSSGLFKRKKLDLSWQPIAPAHSYERSVHKGEPLRVRKISAFAVHPENINALAVATKHALYRSNDGGVTWNEFSIPAQWRKHYFTALAFGKTGEIFVGTSFGGVFAIYGNTMRHFSDGLPHEKYSPTLDFYDTCGAFAISDTQELCVGMNFSGKIYLRKHNSSRWDRSAEVSPRGAISDIQYVNGNWYVSANGKVYRIDGQTQIYPCDELNDLVSKVCDSKTIGVLMFSPSQILPPLFIGVRHPFEAKGTRAGRNPSPVKALYANPHVARKSIDALIEVARSCEFNALVIDMKDDFGAIYFPTENPIAKTIGACKRPLDVQAILAKLHAKQMRAIARVVVFKDKYLYRAFNGAYAVGALQGGSWMGNPREFWLDPHSEFVQKYVVDLAAELEKLGFDEIQFDYIRFPSDGPIDRCVFRHRKDSSMFKSEAIVSLLRYARKRITIPISVDVYGITAWYHFGNRIGQDFEAISEYADAMCPMVYPSHFGTMFYRKKTTVDLLPAVLVGESIARGRMIAGNNAVIRPYLQAFNLLSPTWGPEYILSQIRAAEREGATGFTFWNAKGDYEMVRRAVNRNDLHQKK